MQKLGELLGVRDLFGRRGNDPHAIRSENDLGEKIRESGDHLLSDGVDDLDLGQVAVRVGGVGGQPSLRRIDIDANAVRPPDPNVAIGVETSIWPLSTTLPPNIVKVPLMTLNRAEFDDELAS